MAAKGGGIITLGRLFEFANRFVMAFLLARLLAADQFGLYSVSLSISAIVVTISLLGLDDTIMRFVAIYSGQRHEARLWGVLQFCVAASVTTSLVLGALLFFFSDAIAETIFHDQQLAAMIRLVSLIAPFLTLSEILMFATYGFKKMEYAVIAQTFVQLPVRLILVLILALIGITAYSALFVYGLADLIASVLLLYFINREFPLRRPLLAGRRNPGELIRFSLPFWFTDLMNTFRNNFQTLLLGSLSTLASAGIFTVVNRVNLLGHMSYRSFLTSSKPIIADLQARQEWGQIERLYQTTSRWALTINLPLVLIMILFPKQILAIFGQSFVGGANALVILACAEFINVITGTSGPIIDMTGLNRLKMANSILVVTVSIGANVLFIPMWGLIGAAAAAFVSVAVINSARMIEVYVLYRLLPYNRTLLKPLVAGLAAVAAALLLRNWYPGSQNLIYLVIGATFVLGVYALALAALGLPPEDRLVLNRAFQHAGRLVDRGRAVFRRDYAVKSSLD